MLFERPLVEQFEAEGTGEVLGMKLLSHGRDALASNWFLALSTESTTLGMVVDLTVWLALQVIVDHEGMSPHISTEKGCISLC